MRLPAVVAITSLLVTFGAGCGGRSVTNQDGSLPSAADGLRADARPPVDATNPLTDSPMPGPDSSPRVDCDPSGAMCDAEPGPCPPGDVRSVENNCWGPCVDWRLCAPVDCDTAKVQCRAMQPDCTQQGTLPSMVSMVKDRCWGPCVPIEICACTPNGPRTQCPLDSYVCHNYRGACGPLE